MGDMKKMERGGRGRRWGTDKVGDGDARMINQLKVDVALLEYVGVEVMQFMNAPVVAIAHGGRVYGLEVAANLGLRHGHCNNEAVFHDLADKGRGVV